MDPSHVLSLAVAMGVEPGRLLVVGCEPSEEDAEEESLSIPLGLSEPVARAVEPAAERVNALIESWFQDRLILVPAPVRSDHESGGLSS